MDEISTYSQSSWTSWFVKYIMFQRESWYTIRAVLNGEVGVIDIVVQDASVNSKVVGRSRSSSGEDTISERRYFSFVFVVLCIIAS